MVVNVIEIREKLLVVEYTDRQGIPQRKLVSKEYYPVQCLKGPMDMRDYILRRSINYSDVDLQLTLGPYIEWLPTDEITKALRYAGLWTREDIRANPNDVILVVKRLAAGDTNIKPNDVLQAALTPPDASVNRE